jgi:hypothetical protein
MRKTTMAITGILVLVLLCSGFFLYAGSASGNKFCLPGNKADSFTGCKKPAYTFIPSIVIF